MITILYRPEVRSILHTLYPLVLSKHYKEFHFEKDLDKVLKRPKSKIIVLSRYFKEKSKYVKENREVLEKLRQIYEKVIYIDDSDGADSAHFELIDLFDLYYKSQLVRDRSLFFKDMYGQQFFSDYYHEKCNVIDTHPDIRERIEDSNQLEKLRIFWNLGVGSFPMSFRTRRLLERLTPYINFPQYGFLFRPREIPKKRILPSKRNLKKIQARFYAGRRLKSIDYQRQLFIDKIAKNKDNFYTEYIQMGAYYKELEDIAAVLSPFGWGEICFRDFESIIYGAILIKPDMSHLETWPDIYHPNHTYISIDWMGKNFTETCENILENLEEYDKMADNAYTEYFSQLASIDSRIEGFINELNNL